MKGRLVPARHASARILSISPEVSVDGRQLCGGSVVANGQVTQALEMSHRLSPLLLTVPATAVSSRTWARRPGLRPVLNRSQRACVSVGTWGTTGNTVVRFIPGPVGM
jgi:hypothetical protein